MDGTPSHISYALNRYRDQPKYNIQTTEISKDSGLTQQGRRVASIYVYDATALSSNKIFGKKGLRKTKVAAHLGRVSANPKGYESLGAGILNHGHWCAVEPVGMGMLQESGLQVMRLETGNVKLRAVNKNLINIF